MREMLFTTWRDYVTWPLDPSRVRTAAERLDLSNARDVVDPVDDDRPVRVTRDLFLGSDAGAFVALEVGDGGDVSFWTEHEVGRLWRGTVTDGGAGMEKHLVSFRAPAQALAEWQRRDRGCLLHEEWRDFDVRETWDGHPIAPAQRFRPSGVPMPKGAVRVTQTQLVPAGDAFESILVGASGGLCLWTRARVWMLWRAGSREQLVELARHPPADPSSREG